MSNAERQVKNGEVRIRKSYVFRITANKVLILACLPQAGY